MASEFEHRQEAPHSGAGGSGASGDRTAVAKADGNGAGWRSLVLGDEATHDGSNVDSTRPRAALFLDSDLSDPTDSERASSELTSPSVISPPYWTHSHSQGHARTVSNVSSESVLPAGAITLQDNETDEGPQSRNFVGRDRNRGCWAKSVQVKDYVSVNGSTTNIGAFVVWNIRVETLSGSYINIRKRYSEFDDFRKRLVQTFPNFEAAVPTLPPKSLLSKFQPRFLEKRRVGLEYFLNCILLNPEFSGSPILKEFLFS